METYKNKLSRIQQLFCAEKDDAKEAERDEKELKDSLDDQNEICAKKQDNIIVSESKEVFSLLIQEEHANGYKQNHCSHAEGEISTTQVATAAANAAINLYQ